MPFNDDIDLDGIDMGEVCGVVTVPPQPILGDSPIDDVPKPPKERSSRNACDVLNWDEKTYTLTLSVSPRLSRKILSDTISEQMSVKRIDKVRAYVPRHPLANLAIFTLQKCGFARTGVELCWERSMVPVKSEPVLQSVKSEKPEPTYWEERLAACRERLDFARRNNIQGNQVGRDLDDEAFYLQKIAEEKAARENPAMKSLDAEIAALQVEIDKGNK